MGPVFEGFQARVVDDQDNDVADDTAGELVVRADDPFAFATGYFGTPEKTIEAWRNLWFHTGDRVVRQADGYFRFVDRLKDSIRRRGENISSFEVEQVLLSHPAVANAAAFPVRSPLAEDEVMAVVVLHSGQPLTESELIAFCEPRLPYFALPRYLEFMNELPSTESGKVQKYKLRERGVTERTWIATPPTEGARATETQESGGLHNRNGATIIAATSVYPACRPRPRSGSIFTAHLQLSPSCSLALWRPGRRDQRVHLHRDQGGHGRLAAALRARERPHHSRELCPFRRADPRFDRGEPVDIFLTDSAGSTNSSSRAR